MSSSPAKHSHPLHPAIVHFPIAFLSTSQLFDIAYYALSHPTTAPILKAYDTHHHLPTRSSLAQTSYLFLIFGLLTALPAIWSGGYELYQLLARQAYLDKIRNSSSSKELKRKTHPKVVTAFIHAGTMDAVVAMMAWNWWMRRGRVDMLPDSVNVGVSALAGLLLAGSGYLGAQLVYTHGVGVELVGKLRKDD